MPPLESVPNVSEGRDLAVVASLGAAFASGGARLLDTHVDGDHHRSVFTIVGADHELQEGLVAGVDAARRVVDLRHHDGVHPRVGAADVVPLVPLGPGDLGRAETVARAVARRVGEELELPVFLYGTLAGGLRPSFFRRGGPDGLRQRVDAGELSPSYGPSRLDPRAGAVLVGVRASLVAFNLVLDGTVDVARAVAATVRGSSGGLPGVQALGLRLPSGVVQVSTNLVDLEATALHVMVRAVADEAEARGTRVLRGELVGLLPADAVAGAASATGVDAPLGADGLPTSEALDAAARALRLDELDADRVLEQHLHD